MNQGSPGTVLIVPCFNEGNRLQPRPYLEILESQPKLHLSFVDDGSADATWELLEEIRAEDPERVTTLKLDRNRGKAEAIRHGVLHALETAGEPEGSLQFLGYWDADLSTPLTTLPLLLGALEAEPACRLVMGSRVRLLGTTIVRRPFRHYAGRVFSTLASLALDLPVYDTQCGAKLFRVDPDVRAVFADPFSDPWIFDVEILSRLQALWGAETESRIIELPLPSWEHVGGSKVRLRHGLRALVGLAAIWFRRVR